MGLKKNNSEFSFADVVLESSKKHNCSIKNMQNLNKSIDWNRVEDILMSHYTVGLSDEGASKEEKMAFNKSNLKSLY